MTIDHQKIRREMARWIIIETLNNARPVGCREETMLTVLNAVALHVTQLELRQHLDYLADRKLVEVSDRHTASWRAELTREGVDVAEYTVPVEPGIARPEKYW